jgi:hypothetical protein
VRIQIVAALLVLAVGTGSPAMAQSSAAPAGTARTWIVPTKLSSPLLAERRVVAKRRGIRLAVPVLTNSDSQLPPQRSWAARHPAALGAMIGAAAGAVVGSSVCWGQPPCGDGHGPLLVAFGAGLGAGLGAGVGFTISLANR